MAAKQDEIDLYLDEVNRLSATNAELARDRQKALEEAEKVKLGGLEEAQHASAAVNLEIRLERKEEELSRLHDRLAEVENALESEREAEVQRADSLKRELESIVRLSLSPLFYAVVSLACSESLPLSPRPHSLCDSIAVGLTQNRKQRRSS